MQLASFQDLLRTQTEVVLCERLNHDFIKVGEAGVGSGDGERGVARLPGFHGRQQSRLTRDQLQLQQIRGMCLMSKISKIVDSGEARKQESPPPHPTRS